MQRCGVERRYETTVKRAVLIAAAIVLVAGCIEPVQNGNNNGGGDANGDTGGTVGQGLTIQGPSCTVDDGGCTLASMNQFSVPKVTLSFQNSGQLPVEVGVGSEGSAVLEQLCEPYDLRVFEAVKKTPAGEEQVQGTVSLENGERLELRWFLELGSSAGNASTCSLQFSPTSSQEVRRMKEIQVRADDRIAQLSGLTAYRTATDPVNLLLEVDRHFVQENIGGELKPVVVEAQVQNSRNGTVAFHDPDQPVSVAMDGSISKDCSESGTPGGAGTVCGFEMPDVSVSQTFDIIAETGYTYSWPSRTITVPVPGG